ncbi:MAG: hypothetical protein IJJ75_08220, partial [Firmicutes bacterium]|nr:hypothetical protein [Bacillota bacterium]
MSPKRIAHLQEKMRKKGADAAVYATGTAFVYLLDMPEFWFQRSSVTMGPDTGLWIPSLTRPETVVLVPREGDPVVFSIPRRAEELENLGISPVVCFADH